MKNKIINKLTFLSNDGYNGIKSLIVDPFKDSMYIVEIDCCKINNKQELFDIFGEYFCFPTRVTNWDAFNDWMRDLQFWHPTKGVIIIFHNFDKIFKEDLYDRYDLVDLFAQYILPYWEFDVTRVTDGYDLPRSFDVYCVSSEVNP